MSTLTSQMEKYKDELPSWLSKMESAYQDLESLKREVNKSKAYQILIVYVKYKDLELQLTKQSIFNSHVNAINKELVENLDLMRKSFRVACEVLNQTYDRLEDGQKLTPEIEAVFERLHRKMRFADSEANTKMAEMDPLVVPESLRSAREDEEPSCSLTASAKKRQRQAAQSDDDLHLSMEEFDSQDTESDSEEMHRTFKRPRNLNETQVLGPCSSSARKALTATVTKPRNVHQRLVSDLISEQNVHGGSDLTNRALAFFDRFSLCSLVTLGIGIKSVVPSCWGFKFMPLFSMAFRTSGIVCGKPIMLTIIVLGFFLEIWASSCSSCSWPSTFMRSVSMAPLVERSDRCFTKSSLICATDFCIWLFRPSRLRISRSCCSLISTLPDFPLPPFSFFLSLPFA